MPTGRLLRHVLEGPTLDVEGGSPPRFCRSTNHRGKYASAGDLKCRVTAFVLSRNADLELGRVFNG